MKIGKTTRRLGRELPEPAPTLPQARSIALQSLIFLSQDDERMGRFLALTGVDPADLRSLSQETGFQLALLDHFATDERLLLDFASAEGLEPQQILAARLSLGGDPPSS